MHSFQFIMHDKKEKLKQLWNIQCYQQFNELSILFVKHCINSVSKV